MEGHVFDPERGPDVGFHVFFQGDTSVQALDKEIDLACAGSVAPCCAGLLEERVEVFRMDGAAFGETLAGVGAICLEDRIKDIVG